MNPRKKNHSNLRLHRKIHRFVAIAFLFFFLILSISGILLGLKKHSGGLLLAESKQGSSANISEWLSYDSLTAIAVNIFRDSVSKNKSTAIDRIDARPEKGMVKFVFKEHFTEIQLDAATGALLYAGTRWSDVIEHIHDGSFVDRSLGIRGEYFKLTYTLLMGLSLITLSVTGFFLWKRSGSKKM